MKNICTIIIVLKYYFVNPLLPSRYLYFDLILRENEQSYILFLEHPFLRKKTQNTELKVLNKNVIIVYGTCSGNAEIVSEAIRDGFCDLGLEVELKRSELIEAGIVKDFGLIVLVSSTWDVGKLNMNFVNFDKEFKQLDLSSHFAAVVGLGDSQNYDVFCGAADIMESSVKKSKANTLTETLRIDGEVYSRLNEFREWGKHLGSIFVSKLGN